MVDVEGLLGSAPRGLVVPGKSTTSLPHNVAREVVVYSWTTLRFTVCLACNGR
jgi:hypothetical protein